jgi:hypothetical protein
MEQNGCQRTRGTAEVPLQKAFESRFRLLFARGRWGALHHTRTGEPPNRVGEGTLAPFANLLFEFGVRRVTTTGVVISHVRRPHLMGCSLHCGRNPRARVWMGLSIVAALNIGSQITALR